MKDKDFLEAYSKVKNKQLDEYAMPPEAAGSNPKYSGSWATKKLSTSGGPQTASFASQPPAVGAAARRPVAAPRPAAPAAPAPAQSSARNDDDSASSYWNREAERNRAQGGKPLSNEFNIFGNKPAAPAPAAPKPAAPKPAAPKAQTPQQKSPAQDYGSEKPLPNAAAIRSPAQDYGSERRLPNADAILGNRSETPAPAQRERFTQPPETVATPEDRARFQGRAAQPPETRASEADREAFRARVAGGTYSNPDAVEKESGPTKGKKKMSESLIDAFLKLQASGGNLFSEAKKLKGNQTKLDKNHNGKLDSQDFKMLRGEKMEEAKKADKDYDGDGKVESAKDEVWGSRFKAAKKAGKMEEATSSDPDFAAPRPDGSKKPNDIEFKPKPEEKKPDDKVPLPPKRPDNLKEAEFKGTNYSIVKPKATEDSEKEKDFQHAAELKHIDRQIAKTAKKDELAKAIDTSSDLAHGFEKKETARYAERNSFGMPGDPSTKWRDPRGSGNVVKSDGTLGKPIPKPDPFKEGPSEPADLKAISKKLYPNDEEKESGPKKKSWKEEVSFSEAELAHFEAVIARKDQKGKERGIGDTVDSADLTDEYVMEMARGVKAGTKRGSYKKKATDLAGNKVAGADAATDESDKGIPHVLDQIRSAKENEKGHITLKDHDSDPANPKTASVHRKVARDFYSDYHNTEKPADKNAKLASFKSKVFG